jgi:hypothetical protein
MEDVIEGGGRVLAAEALRSRYETTEETWQQAIGYHFDCFTESEAQCLPGFKDARALRASSG